jgi:methionine-gamma-lyase
MSKKLQRIRDLQHFGEEGGVVPVIDVASTSTFLNPEDMSRTFRGEMPGCYLYSRHSNPTVQMFGKKMAALEGTEAALGVSSGMAAIVCALENIVSNGDHILSHNVVYGGTYALLKNLMPRRGVDVSFEGFLRLEDIEKHLRPRTKVVYVETMSNPLLSIAPFEALKAFKAKHPDIALVVDNTFAPLLLNPIDWGADVVVHSCTKFISGSSDMIAGAICASQSFVDRLIDVNHGPVMLSGPVMDPRVAHELYLRLDHLHVRMKAHSDRARDLAQHLSDSGLNVIYPGLGTHPGHTWAKTYFDSEIGFGGMMTLDLGSPERALKLSSKLQENKFGLYAVSLGFSRTLISCPAVSTSSELSSEDQHKISLTPGLLRLSIGYTGDAAIQKQRFMEALRSL